MSDTQPEASWTCPINGEGCIGPDCVYAFRHEVVYSQPVASSSEPEACRWCNAPRTSHVTNNAAGFSGSYYLCGSHGNSRGERCKEHGRGVYAERERIIGIIEAIDISGEIKYGSGFIKGTIINEIRGGQHE